MSLHNIFGIAGSALNAQTVRLNTVASNLANASTVASSEQEAFKAKRTVFKALVDQQLASQQKTDPNSGGVKVDKLIDDSKPVLRVYEPGNPMADKQGYVYSSNVNEMTEMVEMMAASRSYQNNVEVVNTARQLMMRTIDVLRG